MVSLNEMDLVDDLKRPEYTGENRCLPCTIVNLAIAAAVGALVARRRRVAGALAFGLSAALIYLRGYLVPGTPTLTKRYLPPAVLELFGKEPDPDVASGFAGVGTAPQHIGASADGAPETDVQTTDPTARDASADAANAGFGTDSRADAANDGGSTPRGDPPAGSTVHEGPPAGSSAGAGDRNAPANRGADTVTDLEAYFLDRDVLEPCADVDDLCLTADFEAAWFEEIDAVDEAGIEPGDVVAAVGLDADPESFALETREDVRMLVWDRGTAGRWPSRAALLADVAAARVLESVTDDWDGYDPETRGRILNALRMFLETCPTGGDVRMGEEVVESCCTSHDVVAVTCEETGERLFEQRLDAVDAR